MRNVGRNVDFQRMTLGEPFFRKIRAREDKKVSRRSTDRAACHRSKIKDLGPL